MLYRGININPNMLFRGSPVTPIVYARGNTITDIFPENRECETFNVFKETILEDRAQTKGLQYFCAQMQVNQEGNSIRSKEGALESAFLVFDMYGFENGKVYSQLFSWLRDYIGFEYTTYDHHWECPHTIIVLAVTRLMSRGEKIQVSKLVQKNIEDDIGKGKIKFNESVYKAEQPIYTPPVYADYGEFYGSAVNVDASLLTSESMSSLSTDNLDSPQRAFHEPISVGYHETFVDEPIPPKALIPGILPCEVFGLVAPGGTSKTTLMLWIMVHVILGRPVFEREINDPGPCLFVSAEDDIGTVRYRVRQICDALMLSEDEQRYVSENLYIEDITGKLIRFVEADKQGNLTFTQYPEELIQVYATRGIKLAAFDPAMFFSPGERYINDAEASLMQAARRISRGLGGVATGYIHHTGKVTAREKIIDQYAGRGGSAFADNSRAQIVLAYHDEEDKNWPRPPEVNKDDMEAGRVIRLHVAKFSAGPRELSPIWIVRDKDNPWRFHDYKSPGRTPEARKFAAQLQVEEERIVIMKDVWTYIEEKRQNGSYPNKRLMRDDCIIYYGNKKVGKDKLEIIVDIMVERGFLKISDLPPELRRGMRKEYIDLGEKPIFCEEWYENTHGQ